MPPLLFYQIKGTFNLMYDCHGLNLPWQNNVDLHVHTMGIARLSCSVLLSCNNQTILYTRSQHISIKIFIHVKG